MRRRLWTACFAITVAIVAGDARAGEDPAQVSARLRGMTPIQQIAHLRDLLASDGSDDYLLFSMGNAQYAAGSTDSALLYLKAATVANPGYARAFVNMGILYDETHQIGPARESYRKALEADSTDVLACCHLGLNLYEGGQIEEGVRLFLRALELDPNSAQAHYNLGLSFADARIFVEALREWNRVAELDPDGDLGRLAAENVRLIQESMTKVEHAR